MAYKSQTTPETWQQRYSNALSNQTKQFKRFSNWYDSLYAIVGVVPSPWRSKMFVPVLARQTWGLISKFLGIKPSFEVRIASDDVGDDDVDDRAEKAARKIEFDYENPYLDESMRDKLFAPLLDAVVCGTGMAKVCWKVEKQERYERLPTKDGTVDLSKEKKTTKTVAYNDLEPVNIFNVFVSPAAHNLYEAPWVIIKEHKTIEELKKVNKDGGVEVYKNLDQLSGTETLDDDTSSFDYSRNRLINNQNRLDKTIDLVKIYECYEGDTICTYAESQSTDNNDASWLLLREQKNPYWHGKYPLVKFTIKNKPFQFWGEGLYETTYRLQTGYNDAFNHFMDQWNLAENSMLITPESANVNDYIVEPGGVLTYRGDTAPQQFKHTMPDGNILQELLGLMDQAIEGVTISNYASGIPNSESDKTKGTATGIMHLQDAAGDLVSFMRNNFSQSIVQIGRMWLSNNQQYMQEPVNIVANVKGRKQTVKVSPKDMQGDMQLTVDEASMDPANKDQRIQRFTVYLQQLQQFQQASTQQAQETRWATTPLYLDYSALIQDYSELLDHAQYGNLMLDDKVVQEAIQNSQTPLIAPNERVNIAPNDLLPSEMSQVLQRNGIQPDPGRQQGTPTVNEQVAQGDAAASMAKTQPQQPDQQKSPAESLNYKDAPPDIQRQIEEQAGLQPSQMNQSPANPGADQQTVDLAHGLAQSGHIDPQLLQHLPPLQPTTPNELDSIRQAERTPNG